MTNLLIFVPKPLIIVIRDSLPILSLIWEIFWWFLTRKLTYETLNGYLLCCVLLKIDRIYHFIIHQIFLLAHDWSKCVTWANIPQLKLGNIRGYSPIFLINTIASILLLKYARIFVLGHYLFLEAHSFPRASLSENCSLLGTDNVRGQTSEHILAPNEGYCLYRFK